MTNILEIINLSKSFGENRVLQDINLNLQKGEICTLIGGNGTGKTTLFNLITGFVRPEQGAINYNGNILNKQNPVKINHFGITRTFQDLRLITNLTVKENILLSFKNNHGEKLINSLLPQSFLKEHYQKFSEEADRILNSIHLEKVSNSLAGEISYGQQKLLTLGCCIANDAELMLLDEPVAGIDKDNYKRIFNIIKQLKQDGKTILQIEHNTKYNQTLSDKIWFFNKHKVTEFDDYNAFLANNTVQEAYLN